MTATRLGRIWEQILCVSVNKIGNNLNLRFRVVYLLVKTAYGQLDSAKYGNKYHS